MSNLFLGEELTINLMPKSCPCYNYQAENGEVQTVSAIFVPIRIVSTEDGHRIVVAWACNRSENCQEFSCVYACFKRFRRPDKSENAVDSVVGGFDY